ncbi:hypothetical protein OE88DRAFT_1652119 [Heliocybe sulcata]|uniref:Uncharacterized protein n=1 Tax=Heliocybe sulcata TaxID=5364 RepID=A0A5C3NFE4_9AGAM|nr:hypothetical protein OE88DRAFT_1652119 [Heliocybe sulcata]
MDEKRKAMQEQAGNPSEQRRIQGELYAEEVKVSTMPSIPSNRGACLMRIAAESSSE